MGKQPDHLEASERPLKSDMGVFEYAEKRTSPLEIIQHIIISPLMDFLKCSVNDCLVKDN